jgi:hypothetical protein
MFVDNLVCKKEAKMGCFMKTVNSSSLLLKARGDGPARNPIMAGAM